MTLFVTTCLLVGNSSHREDVVLIRHCRHERIAPGNVHHDALPTFDLMATYGTEPGS